MKKHIGILIVSLFATFAFAMTSCGKEENITASESSLWFSSAEGSQTIEVTSDCSWKIKYNGDNDWYSVSPASGEAGTTTLTVSVQAYPGDEHRDASFTIVSARRKKKVLIEITQNLLEFDNIINKVFGVSKVEHWNTDAFGAIVEDTYVIREYDPYDTATGYTVYFLEDSIGVQQDRHGDSVKYFEFKYYYNVITRILHIEYQSIVPNEILLNDAQVVTACDQMFRFEHEFKPNWWERAAMRKIGTVNPAKVEMLRRKVSKKKKYDPIFAID